MEKHEIAQSESPETLLDAIRDHPEWTEAKRAEQFDRLIARFDLDRLAEIARRRLGDLSGRDGEAVLRLVDAAATPELLEGLAEALLAQPGLPAERAWEALSLLYENGLLEAYPELLERWEELSEALDEEGSASLDQLVEQLEDDPEEVWVALHGLGAVEPEVRAQIVAGLGGRPPGPGLTDFLRLLAFAHDPATRDAALGVLAGTSRSDTGDDPHVVAAWATIAADHPDPDVAAKARRRLGPDAEAAIAAWAGPDRPAPRLVRCLVTALDGRGRGAIVLAGASPDRWAAAAFIVDVLDGVREVIGRAGSLPAVIEELFAEFADRPEGDIVEGAPELALGLLAGFLLVSGPTTPPSLRFWLERTGGPRLRPHPFPGLIHDWDPGSLPAAEWPGRARAVLEARPDWVDESDLAYELAEEIALREGGAPPDPQRDAGLYRYFFEHRLRPRLEIYRRMLFGMASFWQVAGAPELGRSALALAWQLADDQYAVPGHPFVVALTTRSLQTAQEDLRRGIDPRQPGPRTT